MKKLILILMLLSFSLTVPALAAGEAQTGLTVSAPHAILMEKETGTVIWEKDADARVAPASVTKVMTILLIVEALERGELTLEDTVTASARASSMGGSQIYLKEGESMEVRELLKSIVVASANDAAVAMAEYLCGSEAAYVERMNSRAAELKMENTHFNNCTGLFDDDGHYTSARDVAIMSRTLIGHTMIRDYTLIWTDTVRGGQFGLTNTNKLIRRYEGCTGLKTGYTSLAGHCISATAERGGVEYIAVVMGAPSSEERFADASALLNYAFANFALVHPVPPEAIAPVRVLVGVSGSFQPEIGRQSALLLTKTDAGKLEYAVELPEELEAPVAAGQEIGLVHVSLDGEEIARLPLVCHQEIGRRSPLVIFAELVAMIYGGRG